MKVKVEFTMSVPDCIPEYALDEWLSYKLGANGGMSCENPLVDEDICAEWPSVSFRKI